MKRAEFAPGFAELRGNISGKQTLEYAENNNPAFEAPNGVQYARNYRPSVIISKVAKTGKFHFSIKTKSAVKVSNRSKFNMALLGGAGAVRAAILNNPAQRAQVEALYTAAKAKGVTDAKTLEKYIFDTAYEALMIKKSAITFYVPEEATQYYRNPWVFTSSMGAQTLSIKATIIAKFWLQLATDPVMFYVSGMKGIAHAGDNFETIINGMYNVLGLSTKAVEIEGTDKDFVALGDMYLLDGDGAYVTPDVEPANLEDYTLTDVTPVA